MRTKHGYRLCTTNRYLEYSRNAQKGVYEKPLTVEVMDFLEAPKKLRSMRAVVQ